MIQNPIYAYPAARPSCRTYLSKSLWDYLNLKYFHLRPPRLMDQK